MARKKAELVSRNTEELAEKRAEEEATKKQTQSDSDFRWQAMLPTYKDCAETFYDMLKKAADRKNQGVSKTATYFQCLPDSIDYRVGETNVAEIRFQNETNIDFRLTIPGCDLAWQRGLKISTGCGYFEIHRNLNFSSEKCDVSIHVPGWDEDASVQVGQTRPLMNEDLALLIDGQIKYGSETNHVK